MTVYTVGTASDAGEDGTVTGDLAAETADGGGLSLREAVLLANAAADADEIGFAPALSGSTVALAQGELTLSSDLRIDGDLDGDGEPDVTLDAQGASRGARVTAGAAALNGLSVTGGVGADRGGGIRIDEGATLAFSNGAITGNEAEDGGGICNDGIAVLTSSTLSGNAARNDGGGGANTGTMTLIDVTLADNRADDDGGGLHSDSEAALSLLGGSVTGNRSGDGGGGIRNSSGTLTMTDVVVAANEAAGRGGGISNEGTMLSTGGEVSDNAAAIGGGIDNEAGSLILSGTALRGNGATQRGGGLLNDDAATLTDAVVTANTALHGGGIDSAGTLTVARATLSDNAASGSGGALSVDGTTELTTVSLTGNTGQYGGAISASGALTMTGATLADNEADYGGAITTLYGSDTVMVNTTLVGNRAGGGGAGQNVGTMRLVNATVTGNQSEFTDAFENYGTLTAANTIVLGNAAPGDAEIEGSEVRSDGAPNLIGDGTLAAADVFAAIDPATGGGLLADNGGPVRTVALRALPGNPALDAGDDGSAPGTDARGLSRPVDLAGVSHGPGASDLGAFELRDDPVRAADDEAAVTEDGTLVGSAPGVLANDAASEGRSLSVAAVGGDPAAVGRAVAGAYGTLTLGADGAWRYAADAAAADALDAGETARDAFAYTVLDGWGGETTATLSVAVAGRPDPVAALSGPAEVAEGDTATFALAFDRLALADPDAAIGYAFAFTAEGAAGAEDFAAASGSGTLDAAATGSDAWTRAIELEALSDTAFEGPETLTLEVTLTGIAFEDGATRARREITLLDVPPTGGPEEDVLDAAQGDDRLYGRGADDRLSGGGGRDRLRGNGGDDELRGEADDDRLWGGRGDDRLYGGDGDDRLRGRDGADTLRGNRGDDRLWGGAGDDDLYGGRGADRLWGGDGDDRLEGRDGADTLRGEAGRDRLDGGAGDDRLRGGRDDDRLDGGAGDDTLHGGRGRDEFRFAGGADRILDFAEGEDRVRLDDALWSGELDAQGVLATFGSVRDGDAVLDFGGDDRLTVEGVAALSDLAGHLAIG